MAILAFRQPRPTRRAFTLVEMLVVIGIITMLMALILPAVNRARESARKVHCANNLKQLGLATQNYHRQHQVYPLGRFWPRTQVGGVLKYSEWGQHARLLPFLDQQALFDQIDFGMHWTDPMTIHVGSYSIPTFQCPSEPITQTRLANNLLYAVNSYKANGGNKPGIMFENGPLDRGEDNNGIFLTVRWVRHVRDGQSYTALFAESVVGDGDNTIVSLPGDVFPVSTSNSTSIDLLNACQALDPMTMTGDQQQFSETGRNWINGNYIPTRYTHIMPPNSWSCARYDGDSSIFGPGRMNGQGTAMAPSSYHLGGINLCTADGAVRFLADGISPETWMALGSIDGGEVDIDLEF